MSLLQVDKLLRSIGGIYGTEHFSLFLHSLIRMQKPKVVVEFGTGLGASAFAMAAALKANGKGHLWTVDDFAGFSARPAQFESVCRELMKEGLLRSTPSDARDYYQQLEESFDVKDVLTILKGRVDLSAMSSLAEYPFSSQAIDLVFSDFKHGPEEILRILAYCLPRMAVAASIFIHSAATAWASYLLLENVCDQLNSGRVPLLLEELSSADLSQIVFRQRFTLVHLTEDKSSRQNSASWLKLEPRDVRPHPVTTMRGIEQRA